MIKSATEAPGTQSFETRIRSGMNFSIAGKRIALVAGGPGSEREVSLRSAANVANGLRAAGAIVVEIDVRGPDFELPPKTEFAFLMIHGTFGEDGQLQAELERRDMPYSGENVWGSQVAFDKILSKRAFDAAG